MQRSKRFVSESRHNQREILHSLTATQGNKTASRKKGNGKPAETQKEVEDSDADVSVSAATHGSTKNDGAKKKKGKLAQKQQQVKDSSTEDPMSEVPATSDDDYVDNEGINDAFWDDVSEGKHPRVNKENTVTPSSKGASSTDSDSNPDSEPEEVPKPQVAPKPQAPSGKRKEAKKPDSKPAQRISIKADRE